MKRRMTTRSSKSMSYRDVSGYKYALAAPMMVDTGITPPPGAWYRNYIHLRVDGVLWVGDGYHWDGPSGPTVDTQSFMRGSLAHDAIYQLMRLKLLPVSYRKAADKLLYRICREDGMPWWRSSYVYAAVRLWGRRAARPGTETNREVITIQVGGGAA